jgi:hypothetical protein
VRSAVQIRIEIEAPIGAIDGGAVDRGNGVDQARALLKYAVGEFALQVDGGSRRSQQSAFHRVGRQRGIGLQHQRDHAGGHGGCL